MQIKGTAYTDPEEMKYRLIQQLIEQYKKKYPTDWDAAMKTVQIKRAFHKDAYGALGDEANNREVAEIPSHLNTLLETVDPNYFKGKNALEFCKRFPMFVTVTKI